MQSRATPTRQWLCATMLCMAVTTTLAGSLPADWPDLKPGMIMTEGSWPGKSNSKLTQCVTQAVKDAAIKAADEFERTRKECEKPTYSKRGNTSIDDPQCKPAGEPSYMEHTEVTALSSNQIRSKYYRLVNGKETMAMETTYTRTGDCTGKDAPQAGCLESMIEKTMIDAAASKGKNTECWQPPGATDHPQHNR